MRTTLCRPCSIRIVPTLRAITGTHTSIRSPRTPNGQVGNATISVDDSGNLVVIGDDATIAQIQQAVASMDRPKPQVLIKVVFLEVQHNDSLDIGVEGNWGKGIGNSMTGTVANV